MRYSFAMILTLMLALSPSGCMGPRGVSSAPEVTFAFEERLGRDCFMMGLCGTSYVVEGGRLYVYEERDTRTLVDSAAFDAEGYRVLDSLLVRNDFFEAPERVPPGPGGAGGRTLTLRYSSALRAHTTTIAFDAPEPLPEWAYALEEELRRFFEGSRQP